MNIEREIKVRDAIKYCIENFDSQTATNRIVEFWKDELKLQEQQCKPDGYTLLAAGVASRWKRYRDVLYKLYDFTNDVEGYKRSMREYQLIIKAWMQKHKQEIVEAVAEMCKQEDDPRIKIKFMSAGYDLASGQDYALLCSCEMPAKVKGKNECWRCKRPLKEFLQTER